MMKRRTTILILVILAGMGMFARIAASEDVPMMTKEELKALLTSPDLVIIDVRHDKHWTGSDMRIKGAVREGYNDVKSWADKYPKDRLLVLY